MRWLLLWCVGSAAAFEVCVPPECRQEGAFNTYHPKQMDSFNLHCWEHTLRQCEDHLHTAVALLETRTCERVLHTSFSAISLGLVSVVEWLGRIFAAHEVCLLLVFDVLNTMVNATASV